MKNKYIIIGSLLVIGAIALGSTLAWWTWSTSSNEQTNVVVTVGGITINYEDGENITNNNLIPTSTKEQGISKDITVSSTGEVYLDLNMKVVSLDDGLKDASFKYEIYDGNVLMGNGNFVNSNIGDNISLLGGVEVTSTPTTYTLYIWIDGNMSNPNTMYNQNFEFRLNADATDETPGMQTLTKLGLTSNEGTPDFSQVATTDEGIYASKDDYGVSYYFRGAVENNYVQFAGYYWRIIRINGDGSIRMIYDGTSAHANGESSTDRQISKSAYNYTYGDNAYVGYMMGIDNQCTSGSCSGSTRTTSYSQATSNTYSSTIKTTVDNWYKTNIVDTGYSDKVADVIYCNDRSMKSGTGYGTTVTYYGAYQRIVDGNNPVLTCTNQNDRFTVEDTTKGNGALTYPVGLITADEVEMAGVNMETDSNSSYYLYTGNDYRTMSPYSFSYLGYAYTFVVRDGGYVRGYDVSFAVGVRPVISLKSSVALTGNGTMESPFEVVS